MTTPQRPCDREQNAFLINFMLVSVIFVLGDTCKPLAILDCCTQTTFIFFLSPDVSSCVVCICFVYCILHTSLLYNLYRSTNPSNSTSCINCFVLDKHCSHLIPHSISTSHQISQIIQFENICIVLCVLGCLLSACHPNNDGMWCYWVFFIGQGVLSCLGIFVAIDFGVGGIGSFL